MYNYNDMYLSTNTLSYSYIAVIDLHVTKIIVMYNLDRSLA